MLRFTVPLVLALAVVCLAAPKDEIKNKGAEAAKKCYQKLSIPEDSDIFQRVFAFGNIDGSDELIKKFIACVHHNFGWVNEAGDYDRQKIIDFFTEAYGEEKTIKTADTCLPAQGATPEEKAFNLYQCSFRTRGNM
ncbi:uncharacterized protein LOC129748432 [Uranotaenia lowii]|uniref:uncharacterized protein LOC129748432 n=1 Tax=Uranotaenia lowii TaxID=190385 RepID=UPI0024788F33|nr:uncharacterized protein LOC129748432 [Uranotaenia lowii]